MKEMALAATETGEKADNFKRLKPGESGTKTLCYEHEGERKPLRFRVMRKTKEAGKKCLETLRKTRMRKHGNKTLSGAQRACNRYVLPVASITDASPELLPDLYASGGGQSRRSNG
jgi:hypothetical protein